MQDTTVLVVGAGPSGLALGVLLGQMGIDVLILEKETEVCDDPRGIVVNGDAVRISYQLGIGEVLTKRIGKGKYLCGQEAWQTAADLAQTLACSTSTVGTSTKRPS